MSVEGRRIVVTGASARPRCPHRPPPRGTRRPCRGRRPPARPPRGARRGAGRRPRARRPVPGGRHVARPTRRGLVAAAVEALGGIDVLVNNAGAEVQGGLDVARRRGPRGHAPRQRRQRVPRDPGGAPGAARGAAGWSCNLGSTVVARPPHGRFGYVASKAAVEAMTRALAADLGRDGIRVNCIRPGIVPSELRGSTEDEERARFETGLHFGRQALSAVGQGRDIAEAVAWLAGDGRALGHGRRHRRRRRADRWASPTRSEPARVRRRRPARPLRVDDDLDRPARAVVEGRRGPPGSPTARTGGSPSRGPACCPARRAG